MAELEDWEKIFNERQQQIADELKAATEQVYKTHDIEKIRAYEELVALVVQRVSQGELEKMLEQAKRKELDLNTYCEARRKGMTHDEIAEEYRIKNRRILSGYARWYQQRG